MSWVYVPVLSWVNVGMGMVEAGAAMKDEVDKSCGVWECVWGLAGCMYCIVCRCWGRYQGELYALGGIARAGGAEGIDMGGGGGGGVEEPWAAALA